MEKLTHIRVTGSERVKHFKKNFNNQFLKFRTSELESSSEISGADQNIRSYQMEIEMEIRDCEIFLKLTGEHHAQGYMSISIIEYDIQEHSKTHGQVLFKNQEMIQIRSQDKKTPW